MTDNFQSDATLLCRAGKRLAWHILLNCTTLWVIIGAILGLVSPGPMKPVESIASRPYTPIEHIVNSLNSAMLFLCISFVIFGIISALILLIWRIFIKKNSRKAIITTSFLACTVFTLISILILYLSTLIFHLTNLTAAFPIVIAAIVFLSVFIFSVPSYIYMVRTK